MIFLGLLNAHAEKITSKLCMNAYQPFLIGKTDCRNSLYLLKRGLQTWNNYTHLIEIPWSEWSHARRKASARIEKLLSFIIYIKDGSPHASERSRSLVLPFFLSARSPFAHLYIMCGPLAHSFARTTYQARSIPRSLVSPDPLVRQLSRSARLVRSFVCSLERAYGTTNHISTDVVKWRITPLAYSSWISPIPLARLLVHYTWPNIAHSIARSLVRLLAS